MIADAVIAGDPEASLTEHATRYLSLDELPPCEHCEGRSYECQHSVKHRAAAEPVRGSAPCEWCGYEMHQHPLDPSGTGLRITCQGWFVRAAICMAGGCCAWAQAVEYEPWFCAHHAGKFYQGMIPGQPIKAYPSQLAGPKALRTYRYGSMEYVRPRDVVGTGRATW